MAKKSYFDFGRSYTRVDPLNFDTAGASEEDLRKAAERIRERMNRRSEELFRETFTGRFDQANQQTYTNADASFRERMRSNEWSANERERERDVNPRPRKEEVLRPFGYGWAKRMIDDAPVIEMTTLPHVCHGCGLVVREVYYELRGESVDLIPEEQCAKCAGEVE